MTKRPYGIYTTTAKGRVVLRWVDQASLHERQESLGTDVSEEAKLLAMFPRAGIDYVSLANNHILDYGAVGIEQTHTHIEQLRRRDFCRGLNRLDLRQRTRFVNNASTRCNDCSACYHPISYSHCATHLRELRRLV